MLKIIHISDCHLGDSPHTVYKNINPFQSLNSIKQHIRTHQTNIDVVFATGDLSQTGNVESYQLLSKIFNDWDASLFCIPGNHDNPLIMKRHFDFTPIDQLHTISINDFLFILINTRVENQEYGCITEIDLNSIDTICSENADKSIAVLIHHPPIKIQSEWMDKIGLSNGDTLMNRLTQQKNIKFLLHGHCHQEIDIQIEKIKILGTPSTCYQFKPRTLTMEIDDAFPAYRVISLDEKMNISSEIIRVNPNVNFSQ